MTSFVMPPNLSGVLEALEKLKNLGKYLFEW